MSRYRIETSGQCQGTDLIVPGDARPDTGPPGQIDHIIAYCGTAGLLGLGYPAAKLRFGMIVMLISLDCHPRQSEQSAERRGRRGRAGGGRVCRTAAPNCHRQHAKRN